MRVLEMLTRSLDDLYRLTGSTLNDALSLEYEFEGFTDFINCIVGMVGPNFYVNPRETTQLLAKAALGAAVAKHYVVAFCYMAVLETCQEVSPGTTRVVYAGSDLWEIMQERVPSFIQQLLSEEIEKQLVETVVHTAPEERN